MYTGLASTPGRPEICEVEGQRVLTPLGRWQVLQGLAKPEVRYHTVDTHSPLFLVCPRANFEKIHPSYTVVLRDSFFIAVCRYEGDPDLKPICHGEVVWLVRLLYDASRWFNSRYTRYRYSKYCVYKKRLL